MRPYLLDGGHLNGPEEFERRLIERDLGILERTDPGTAHLLRADFASLFGDVERAMGELNIVREQVHGADADLDHKELSIKSNLLFATDALVLARKSLVAGAPDLSSIMGYGLAIGAAQTLVKMIDDTQDHDQVLAASANAIIPLARQVAAALKASGRTEDELAAVINAAGELMRERKLLWIDPQPQIIALTETTDDVSPGVHYIFRMKLTSAEAAELTGELGWRLVDLGLVDPALTVSFMGSVVQDQRAAA